MSDTATAAPAYTPGQIPDSDVRPPPSVWSAGDVHHTHEQIYAESPAGVQAAMAPDPRDVEIMRLNAIIAGGSRDPAAASTLPINDPRDAELSNLRKELEISQLKAKIAKETAELKTQLSDVDQATADSVKVPESVQVASGPDPRDAEIAKLKADLEAENTPPDAAPDVS